jgi:predicted TPR repeat methyltransferase
LFEKEQKREAEESLTSCLKLAPDYVDGWMRLGSMYVSMKRRSDAINAFKKVLTISDDPDVKKQANWYLSALGAQQ